MQRTTTDSAVTDPRLADPAVLHAAQPALLTIPHSQRKASRHGYMQCHKVASHATVAFRLRIPTQWLWFTPYTNNAGWVAPRVYLQQRWTDREFASDYLCACCTCEHAEARLLAQRGWKRQRSWELGMGNHHVTPGPLHCLPHGIALLSDVQWGLEMGLGFDTEEITTEYDDITREVGSRAERLIADTAIGHAIDVLADTLIEASLRADRVLLPGTQVHHILRTALGTAAPARAHLWDELGIE